MALADDLQGDISTLLADPDFGRDATLRRIVPGSYNDADGSTATPTTTDYSVRCLLLNYADRVIDGQLIKQSDRKCILDSKGLAITPDLDDRVVVGSAIYTVVNPAKQVELGGTTIVYILQIRR